MPRDICPLTLALELRLLPVPNPIGLPNLDRPPSPEQTRTSRVPDESTTTSPPPSLMALPPEIREIVYQYYFLSYQEKGLSAPVGIDGRKLSYNHAHTFSGIHIAFPPLLHTSRVIRHEAAKPFFNMMTFDMRFPTEIHQTLCTKRHSCPGHHRYSDFGSYDERVRETLLAEPLSFQETHLIRSASLDIGALSPKAFRVLGRCCPALKTLILDVGKHASQDHVLVSMYREIQSQSSLLQLGLTYLPSLACLSFRLALWRFVPGQPLDDISGVVQGICELVQRRNFWTLHDGPVNLHYEVIPVFADPGAIVVYRKEPWNVRVTDETMN